MCEECKRLKDVLLSVRGLLPPRVCPVAVAYIDRALDDIPGLPSPEQSEESRSATVKRFVELEIWEALNVVGYPARGETVQAPKKVCKLVNYIGDKWIESLTDKDAQP